MGLQLWLNKKTPAVARLDCAALTELLFICYTYIARVQQQCREPIFTTRKPCQSVYRRQCLLKDKNVFKLFSTWMRQFYGRSYSKAIRFILQRINSGAWKSGNVLFEWGNLGNYVNHISENDQVHSSLPSIVVEATYGQDALLSLLSSALLLEICSYIAITSLELLHPAWTEAPWTLGNWAM